MKKRFKFKRIYILLIALVLCIFLIPFHRSVRRVFESCLQIVRGKKTVNERVNEFSGAVKERLAADFKKLGIEYPPSEMVFVCLKEEKFLEVWIADDSKHYQLLKTYPILGASGRIGPKLKEGDGQVPEGIYSVDSLNPNSMFHLSIRLDYPNNFDKKMAKYDGRTELGSDIMIHGNTCSVGCLAMGDKIAEDLFVLTALTGPDNVKIIISPIDLRKKKFDEFPDHPVWIQQLYDNIKNELKYFVQ